MATLKDLEKVSPKGQVAPFNVGLIHLGLGEREQAIADFERAYAADSEFLFWLVQDHLFDPLRKEPRFVALMKKLNAAT